LDEAEKLFTSTLEQTNNYQMKGYVYNNLGISNFFNFIEKSTKITDAPGGGMEVIGEIMAHFEKGI
jgi:hypothetical protein